MTPRRFAPYSEPAANEVYHLLFCDDPAAFAPRAGQAPAAWQHVLYGESISPQRVRALAEDVAAEGRVRLLAYGRLRARGDAAASRELLGVIVEVGLDDGLDVLAAYVDGGVRYINHSGKMSFAEGAIASITPRVQALFAAARTVVARIGPWDRERLPPPKRGNVRLTFLVADGLYFGEGPRTAFERDPMAGPVLAAATALLAAVVDLSTAR